jgi:hypothetical protein
MRPKIKEVSLFCVEKNIVFFNSLKLVSSTNFEHDPTKPNKDIAHTRKHSFQINFELEARLQKKSEITISLQVLYFTCTSCLLCDKGDFIPI